MSVLKTMGRFEKSRQNYICDKAGLCHSSCFVTVEEGCQEMISSFSELSTIIMHLREWKEKGPRVPRKRGHQKGDVLECSPHPTLFTQRGKNYLLLMHLCDPEVLSPAASSPAAAAPLSLCSCWLCGCGCLLPVSPHMRQQLQLWVVAVSWWFTAVVIIMTKFVKRAVLPSVQDSETETCQRDKCWRQGKNCNSGCQTWLFTGIYSRCLYLSSKNICLFIL